MNDTNLNNTIMAYCNNCGTPIAPGAKFCPTCGTPAGATAAPENRQAPSPTIQEAQQPQSQQQQDNIENKFAAAVNSTADITNEFDSKDIEQNKVMALLSYLGILVLIPIFGAKDSKFARFHANQGLILCIACILYGITYSVLSGIILAISWRLYFLVSIIGLVGFAFAILAVIGIINALNGKAKELPFIGKYKLLK